MKESNKNPFLFTLNEPLTNTTFKDQGVQAALFLGDNLDTINFVDVDEAQDAVGVLRIAGGDTRVLSSSGNFAELSGLFEKVLLKKGATHANLPADYVKEVVEFLTDDTRTVIPDPFIPPKRSIVVWLASPANLLIEDPQGRRIGFDPQAQSPVNDFPDAFYSGPDTEPEFIEIADPDPGEHSVKIVGTGEGNILTGVILVNAMGQNTRVEEERSIRTNEVIAYSLILQPAGSSNEMEVVYTSDTDGDGILNSEDVCAHSDLSAVVVIDGCNSGVPNTLLPTGCSISDQINQCAVDARNHGGFVSCVTTLANDLKKSGIITGKQKGAIQSCAAKADIP